MEDIKHPLVEATVTVRTPIVLCHARQCVHNTGEGLCALSVISISASYSPDCQMYEKRKREEE